MPHTPSPWYLMDNGDGPKPNALGAYTVFFGHGYASSNQICDTRHLEDARLIAAAPDMLAALEFIRNYARDSRTGRMLTGEGYAMADAAISKAKGGV